MVVEIEQIIDAGDFVASDNVASRVSLSERWNSALAQLEQSGAGRAILNFMRWGVVALLIAAGYFGASAVDAGLKVAKQDNPASQQFLATSSAN